MIVQTISLIKASPLRVPLPATSIVPWTQFINPSPRLYSSKPKTLFVAPGPIPLGDKKARLDMEKLLKGKRATANEIGSTTDEILDRHPDAEKEPLPAFDDGKNPKTGEQGGPKGLEPTRYGDWERKGRVFDF